MGNDHLPIEILIDAQPHKNIHTNSIRYKFNQTDREVFESTLKVALSSGDVSKLKSTQDIDKYADFIVTAISTAVDKAIPTSKSGHPESQLVSEESLALIKEKHRLRRQYLLAGSVTLFLIDDIIADEALDECCQLLLGLAISGRHRAHFLWLLTQSYTAVPIISGDKRKCFMFGIQKTERT